LLIADDGSNDPQLAARLREFASADSRIRVTTLEENRGIALASNAALKLATGEFVGFLDHDDMLEPEALFRMAQAVQENPEADVLYSDEGLIDAQGRFERPIFKPDWSPDAFRSANYLCHLTLVRRGMLEALGGFRAGFDGAQDYDLLLRATEQARQIVHVPRVLYHWRMSGSSTASDVMNKPAAIECGRRAVEEAITRRGMEGAVLVLQRRAQYRVVWPIEEYRKVAVVISGSGRPDLLKQCVESISAQTDYPNYEIAIAEPGSAPGLNRAARQTDAPWILFLRGDMQVITPEWLSSMVEHIQRPDVGAVGGKAFLPDKTIQHAGMTLTAGAAPLYAPAESWKNSSDPRLIRNCSAVSAACMLTRRDLFERLGGFDETLAQFSDVDFCLKLRQAGFWIVFTPFAELIEHAPAEPDPADSPELRLLQSRWPEVFARDSFGNPNLGFYAP
jgi:GT2 family glycosyltransferase